MYGKEAGCPIQLKFSEALADKECEAVRFDESHNSSHTLSVIRTSVISGIVLYAEDYVWLRKPGLYDHSSGFYFPWACILEHV